MKLIKIEITKKELCEIPENERKYFIQLTSYANEIYVLQKYAIFSASIEEQDVIVRRAHNMQALFMHRLLAGKLWEGWVLLEKFFFKAKLSYDYFDKFSDEVKEDYKYIKKYFDNKSICQNIRNQFSFHYSKESADMVETILKSRPDEEKFVLFFSENHGNCFYDLSDTLINHAILNMTKTGKEETPMQSLLKDISEVTKHFLHLIGECVLIFSKRHFNSGYEEIEVTEEVDINSVHIPYFVKKIDAAKKKGLRY